MVELANKASGGGIKLPALKGQLLSAKVNGKSYSKQTASPTASPTAATTGGAQAGDGDKGKTSKPTQWYKNEDLPAWVLPLVVAAAAVLAIGLLVVVYCCCCRSAVAPAQPGPRGAEGSHAGGAARAPETLIFPPPHKPACLPH